MIVIRNAALAAIASACLVSGAYAQDRESFQVPVRYSDLNLGSSEGRAALHARIRSASVANCPAMDGTLMQKMDSQRCRNEMMRDGEQQLAHLAAPADQRLAFAQPR